MPTTDTTPQARRVMAARGVIAPGMEMVETDNGYRERLGDPRDGACWDFMGEHSGQEWLPDLNDAATCAALEAQLIARAHESSCGWEVRHRPELTRYAIYLRVGIEGATLEGRGITAQADALAAAFEWLASLEATYAQG